MVSDGDWPHAEPQEILRRAALDVPLVIGLALSQRHAAEETKTQRPQRQHA